MTPRLFVPFLEPEDVIRHLGKGVKHWKAGRSAHALANRWFAANAIPPIVSASFERHPVFSGARLVDGFLERSVDLPDGARPTQTDLLALLRVKQELAVAAVEGKVDEAFGPLVSEWLDKGGRNKERLSILCNMLGLKICAPTLRYQLLHRTASALIEAERYCAKTALLLVHSFSPERACFADYGAFLAALDMSRAAEPGTIYGPRPCRIEDSAIDLYAVWIADDCADLSSEDLFWNRLRAYAARLSGEAAELIGWADARARRT